MKDNDNKHIGSSFDSRLEEERILESVTKTAMIYSTEHLKAQREYQVTMDKIFPPTEPIFWIEVSRERVLVLPTKI